METNKVNYKEEINAIADILELGETKISNESLQMLCPFHEETEASFGINVKTGAYNCFACHECGHITKLSERLNGHIVPYKTTDILHYKVNTLIDKVSYKTKPKKDMGNITNRIVEKNFVEYSIEDIISLIVSGHTVIPAGAKSNKDWKHQQLVMIDFDNKYSNYTRDDVLTFAKNINLVPTFSYYTFSNTTEKEKFRFVYCFKEIITDKKSMENIINSLLYNFKDFEADIQCRQLCSKFLGTTDKNVIYSNYIYDRNVRFSKDKLNKVEKICINIKDEKKEINTLKTITAKELLNTELEPLNIIVNNLLYSGFSIMAGAPKVR